MARTERLESPDDPRAALYAKLTNRQLRASLEAERGVFIAESPLVVECALDSGAHALSFMTDETHASAYEELYARAPLAPVYVLPHAQLDELVGYRIARGLLAAFERPRRVLDDELARCARRLVVLEDLVDVSNVGSVFRSAAALGADGVLLSPRCADPLSRRALRTSMGCALKLPFAQAEADEWPQAALGRLREGGFKVLALALADDARPLSSFSALGPTEKLALAFGNEATGLSAAALAACDGVVTIPMSHGVDSLNVAACSAVALWHFFAGPSASEA